MPQRVKEPPDFIGTSVPWAIGAYIRDYADKEERSIGWVLRQALDGWLEQRPDWADHNKAAA